MSISSDDRWSGRRGRLGTGLVVLALVLAVPARGARPAKGGGGCNVHEALSFLRAVYLGPLRLTDAELSLTTYWFEASTDPDMFNVAVSPNTECTPGDRSELFKVEFRFRSGRLSSVYLGGRSGLAAGTVPPEEASSRRHLAVALLDQMMGTLGVASEQLDEERRCIRVVFNDARGKADPVLHTAIFDLETGLLLMAGAP